MHAHKWLFVSFWWKFWHRNSILWPRFPFRERYFGALRTFFVHFCSRYAECPPYFNFRSTWPTDLERVSRISFLTMKISAKFEVDMTIRCLVIAFFLLIHYVTLTMWPWSLTYWSGSVVTHDPLHVQFNPSTKFEDSTAIYSWVMSSDTSTLNMTLTT